MQYKKTLLLSALLLPLIMNPSAAHANKDLTKQQVKAHSLHCSSGNITLETESQLQCSLSLKDSSNSRLTFYSSGMFIITLYPNSNGSFSNAPYLVEEVRNILRMKGKNEDIAAKFEELPFGDSEDDRFVVNQGVRFSLPTRGISLKYSNYQFIIETNYSGT